MINYKETVDCGVGGEAEASIWEVEGDDTWAEGAAERIRQTRGGWVEYKMLFSVGRSPAFLGG